MGIRVADEGKSVLKTRGDHAPDVITRRVHGTAECQLWSMMTDYDTLTICLRAILTYSHPTQYTMLISRHRQRPCGIVQLNSPLVTSSQQPSTETQGINLRRRPTSTYNFRHALLRPSQPLRPITFLFPGPIMTCKLRSTCPAFQPVFSAPANCLFTVLAQ
jgi:hypothetical protein